MQAAAGSATAPACSAFAPTSRRPSARSTSSTAEAAPHLAGVIRLAHLSDLHFGTEDDAMVKRLLAELAALQPRLIVVSGDLTQRARRRQFAAARAFLDRLGAPHLVLPGNHDIPLYDVGRRIASPMGRYRQMITRELDPIHLE